MNIVISHDFFPKIGGAHLWLYEVYRRWPERVYFLTICNTLDTYSEGSSRDFWAKDHGAIEIIRWGTCLSNINFLDIAFVKQVYLQLKHIKKLTAQSVPTIHCLRAFPEGLLGLLFKQFFNRSSKLITYAHGEEIFVARSSRQLTFLAKTVFSKSDIIIANSQNTKTLVIDIARKANVVCIHPGVDVQSFSERQSKRNLYRQQLGWPENTVIVCTIARMEPRKNHIKVIQAINQLRNEGLPVAYICGSDGEEKSKLVDLVRSLGIAEWVRFPGFVSDQEKYMIYAASDIYAMPSVQLGEMFEGFGIVFLEAAASGIPSIAGNNGGQAEAVRHGKTGLIIDGCDLKACINAIRLLAENHMLRTQMGDEGMKWAAENDWLEVAKKTYTIVNSHAKASIKIDNS